MAKQKHNLHQIKTTKAVYPQIYSYILPKEPENEGSQKIGYTERRDFEVRVREQTQTPAKRFEYEVRWHHSAFFADNKTDFKDKTFHDFLIKKGIPKRDDLGTEWFYFNGTPEMSEQLFHVFREQGFTALQNDDGKISYILRTEQDGAVNLALENFNSPDNHEVLWNAKPRFGKTLASYDLAKRLNAKKVLIVTNRPAIANSWFEDFTMFVDGYYFISEASALKDRATLTRDQFIEIDGDKAQITFLSLQDLKGSKYFGGPHNKLQWIADLEWDLLVIDEAHEGIDTGRTDAAFDVIKRKHTLHLSGTPFKALANQKFPEGAIYNWTYLDEQKIKKAELGEDEKGDHTDLPDLKLFTYRISQMITDEVNEGIEIDDQSRDYAFDLNEFFATQNQKFIREDEVRQFLKALTTNEKYPFSTHELRSELKHTFWYVGNRVDSVKALAKLLEEDAVFGNGNYKIVIAAGDGKSFEEEEHDIRSNEKSFDKVKQAIAENDKTITLSCGQLTTGVTIKEWSAVLMLTDIKSPSTYMQAAFRAQNPHRFLEDGELKAKESAYLFDFAPIRVLEIYDTFANALNPKAANGEITEEERKQNIKELLNFFPVISEDIDGQMVELDAEKVLTFPNALAATEIVQARFMTNLLFNDNVKGVFHFPKAVEEILDKLPKEKNKRPEVSKTKLDLDDARKLEDGKQKRITENSEIILGEKIYGANIERIVDGTLSTETPDETLDNLPERVADLTDNLIAKYKEVYHKTNSETEEIKQELGEKVKIAVAEYQSAEIKDEAKLKEDLKNIIEHDFVQTKVEREENKAVEEVQKTKEDEVREHLRAFTRTIPMFIMANSSREKITIDNFDEQISDEDFIDLTNITKDEFHMLRDGFDYEEYDENEGRVVGKKFGGVFDRYKFNASIAEFVAEKRKRANYFQTDEDIFELIPNQKNNQIFTPKKVVKMMIDGLEEHDPELFRRTDSKFIDLYMKSGMYITEIVKKLFANTRGYYGSDEDCLRHILENQVYGLAPTGVLYGITNSYIFGFDENGKMSNKNFAMCDMLPFAKGDKPQSVQQKLAELFNGGEDMKFDAVVGNPPYNDTVSKTNAQSQGNSGWIYHYFQLASDKIASVTCLIYPFGGWFDSPKSLSALGEKILSDGHTVLINAYEGTSDKRAWYRNDKEPNPIFKDGANLSAGVSVVLRDFNKVHGTYRYSNRIYSDTVRTVQTDEWTKLSPDPDFSVGSKLFGERLEKHTSNKTFGIESDFIENNPNLASLTSADFKDPIKLLTNDKSGSSGRAKWFYVDRSTVLRKMHLVDEYKVAMPSAYPKKTLVSGNPTIENVSRRIEALIDCFGPGEIFGRSKMLLFSSSSELESNNFMKYTKTRFFSYLVLNEPNRSFSFGFVIPTQDFTASSDIDWSRSIPEIDQQLYRKYHLDEKEIAFIESRVKPMK